MDGVVRYMPAIFVFDYYFETSCSGILLFVDFQNKALIFFVEIGLGASEFSRCQWLFVFHPMSPDTIYRSDANLHLFCDDSGANVVGFSSNDVFDLGRS